VTAAEFAVALKCSLPTAYVRLAKAGIQPVKYERKGRRGCKSAVYPPDAVERYRAWEVSRG
jgi:hypothetical protein